MGVVAAIKNHGRELKVAEVALEPIITATSPTAESSSIATTLIARVRAAGSMAGPVFAAGARRGVGVLVGAQSRSIRLLRRTAQPPSIRAPSAALIIAAGRAASPFAGSPASAVS